jgi:hypothetical protein
MPAMLALHYSVGPLVGLYGPEGFKPIRSGPGIGQDESR